MDPPPPPRLGDQRGGRLHSERGGTELDIGFEYSTQRPRSPKYDEGGGYLEFLRFDGCETYDDSGGGGGRSEGRRRGGRIRSRGGGERSVSAVGVTQLSPAAAIGGGGGSGGGGGDHGGSGSHGGVGGHGGGEGIGGGGMMAATEAAASLTPAAHQPAPVPPPLNTRAVAAPAALGVAAVLAAAAFRPAPPAPTPTPAPAPASVQPIRRPRRWGGVTGPSQISPGGAVSTPASDSIDFRSQAYPTP